jgi:hypothetical protein
MARGKKTGGRNFPKGKSGNPTGRPKLPQEIKDLKKLTAQEFITRITKFLYLTKDELKAGINSGQIDVLDLCIRNALIKCAEKGDYWTLDKMMERLIGKAREGSPDDSREQLKELIEAIKNAAAKDIRP